MYNSTRNMGLQLPGCTCGFGLTVEAWNAGGLLVHTTNYYAHVFAGLPSRLVNMFIIFVSLGSERKLERREPHNDKALLVHSTN